MKTILADVEESTLFLLDHLPENATADQLIVDFTKIQDEYDDLTEKFSSLVKSATANQPEETCNNRSAVDLQQRADTIIDATSGETLAVDNHIGPSIQNDPPNNTRLSSADVQPQADTQQPTPSTTLDPPHNTLSHLARPKLKIEPYDGDPMKWNLWYGLFKTLIHDQPISLAEKMTHLQTLTIGVANQAISGFSCNSQMYDAAITELQRRFGRPEIIVNKFLHLLQNFRQPSVQHRNTFTEFSTFVNNLVETFQSLGFYNDLNSTLYVQFAVNKLPPTQRLQWSQYAVTNNLQQPSLIHFNIWMRHFALACDNLPYSPDNRPSTNSTTKDQTPSRFPQHKQNRQLCRFDKIDHHPSHCSIYKNANLQQKRQMVLDNKLCLNCLGHHLKNDCKSQHNCRSCNRKHHTTLHDENILQTPRQHSEQSNDNSRNSKSTTKSFANSKKPLQNTQFAGNQSSTSPPPPDITNVGALLMVVPVTLENENTFISTYAFLDSGSTCSYLLSNVASNLQCKITGPAVKLDIGGFHESKSLEANIVSVKIHPFGNIAESFTINHAFVLPSFNLADVDTTFLNDICQQFPHLQSINFPQLLSNQIGLILGQDNFDLITARTVFKGPPNAPRAVLTNIGWTIGGPHDSRYHQSTFHATTFHCPTSTDSHHDDDDLYDLLASFWRMENFGINPEVTMSKEEKHALNTLRDTIRFVDNRYEVGLLWKPNAELPNNFAAAIQQFKKLKQRLNRDPITLDLYSATIENDLKNEYIRRVPADDIPSTGWLLPEHGVLHPNKPGKLRRVSNARAKYKGVCLNDMLLFGPDLLANLLGIILRFRENKYSLSADIEAMYMQVSVRPDDRKFLRFLWGENDPQFFEYLRFVFGAKCSPTCANFALQTCADDHSTDYPHIQRLVRDHFYMDDLFVSTDTVQQAVQIIHDSRTVLSRWGFNLTKWITNCLEILSAVPSEHRALQPEELDHAPKMQKVLGVEWNLSTDELQFSPDKLKNQLSQKPTQRTLLRATSSVFDPLGIAAPVTIRFRIIQQTIWRKGLKWDDPITPSVLPEFFVTVAELPELSSVTIPRQYFRDKPYAISLHVFTDASYSALAAVAYFVYRCSPSSPPEVCFALGKARVAPLQQHTITKLELQAALLGSRLAHFVQHEQRLSFDSIHLWTDSTTVLQWIYGSHQRQQIFVANRVAEILTNTQSHQWNHCPGETNPADDGTRGIPFRDFHSNTRWFQGPEFLKQPVSQWPSNPVHTQLTTMRCTRRTSQKNCFHANDDATDVAKDDATDVAKDDATDVAKDDATDVAKDDASDVAKDDATDVAKDDATDVAKDDATAVANEDATDVANDDATDVATEEEVAHGATKDKAADVATNVQAPHTDGLRNAEDATHNSDAAALLTAEDAEEAEDVDEAAEISTATEVADEDLVGTDATVVATVSTPQCAMEHVNIASTCSKNTCSQAHLTPSPSSSSIVQQDTSHTLEVSRFSSWKRLVRVTAFVLRAIKKYRSLRFRSQTPYNVTNCRNMTPSLSKFHSSSFRSLSPRHAVPFPSADEMSDAKMFFS